MTENAFFRNITLEICGHLKIEEGLRACIRHLSAYMPADRLYLERHDHGLGEMRPLARANMDGCEKIDKRLRLSAEARASMKARSKTVRPGLPPPLFIYNRPADEPILRDFLQELGEPLSSALWMPLIVEDRPIGALILLAEGDHRYNDTHARLFGLLREPFFTAMSNALQHEQVVDDNRRLRNELLHIADGEIIGADQGLKDTMQQVRRVAPTESVVLLTGETGVGKDLIAAFIHNESPRCNGPFIPVNCGAIPDALIDSELFGHEKGAFTGALSQKLGRFERAHNGTIFLDEIGELPPPAQVRLLRVLQQREIERVGAVKTIPLDIRIIAATNRDLDLMVKNQLFREDLWFRLNVFPVCIPPLRERKMDLPSLVRHFIEVKARELKLATTPTLAPGMIDTLLDYHWPGNIRELQNVIERALILNPTGPLRFDHLNHNRSIPNLDLSEQAGSEDDRLDEVVSRHILRVLGKSKRKGKRSGRGRRNTGNESKHLARPDGKAGYPSRSSKPDCIALPPEYNPPLPRVQIHFRECLMGHKNTDLKKEKRDA